MKRQSAVPNFITCASLVLCGLALAYGQHGMIGWAIVAASGAFVLQCLDGLAAELAGGAAFGAFFASLGGFMLAGVVSLVLCINGAWNVWVLIGIAAIAVILQMIGSAYKSNLWPSITWHQHYIHPLFSVMVTIYGIATMIWLNYSGAQRTTYLAIGGATLLVLVALRFGRIKRLMNRPGHDVPANVM